MTSHTNVKMPLGIWWNFACLLLIGLFFSFPQKHCCFLFLYHISPLLFYPCIWLYWLMHFKLFFFPHSSWVDQPHEDRPLWYCSSFLCTVKLWNTLPFIIFSSFHFQELGSWTPKELKLIPPYHFFFFLFNKHGSS